MGSGERTDGMAAGVAAAMAEQPAAVEARAVQLPLIGADDLAALPAQGYERVKALRTGRPGRPVGAINRSTDEWRRYLLSRYASPLQVLCETFSRPVADLMLELGCTRLEAFRIQMMAAAEAAPYLHGKMPIEVAVTGRRAMFIMADPKAWLAEMGASLDEQGALLADLRPISGTVIDQEVSGQPAVSVAQPELHGEGIASADQSVSSAEPVIEDHGDGPSGGGS
jgi:hypothetical protein